MHRASDYDFELPESLIAAEAPSERDGARLLVIGKDGVRHEQVRDLPSLLPPGALLVVNDTRVLPARLFATKPTGGRVELLLCDRVGTDDHSETWRALAQSSKPMRMGALTIDGEHAPTVEVLSAEPPYVELRITPREGESVDAALERVGEIPLPPYIVKARAQKGEQRTNDDDRARYQTVFADKPGAVAAPTAGLHLSHALLEQLAQKGIHKVAVTLHVGPGTFSPLRSDVLDENQLHAEPFEISQATADAINAARDAGRPIVAVGTTVVRTLEASADDSGHVRAGAGSTSLFIKPGHRWKIVDRLLSNFHLPCSSLLVLVATFAGRERVLDAYREAVANGYRFYSYGDATLSERAS